MPGKKYYVFPVTNDPPKNRVGRSGKIFFRVGPFFVGSVGLPETHNFFQLALGNSPTPK